MYRPSTPKAPRIVFVAALTATSALHAANLPTFPERIGDLERLRVIGGGELQVLGTSSVSYDLPGKLRILVTLTPRHELPPSAMADKLLRSRVLMFREAEPTAERVTAKTEPLPCLADRTPMYVDWFRVTKRGRPRGEVFYTADDGNFLFYVRATYLLGEAQPQLVADRLTKLLKELGLPRGCAVR